jgi:hypothetical protein
VRRAKEALNIEALPVYPEGRPCSAPTADGVMRAFEGIRLSQLRDDHGNIVRTFHDRFFPVASQIVDLLGLDRRPFGG